MNCILLVQRSGCISNSHALLRAIKELGEELGVLLFARTTRSTRLTRAGHMFLEHVPRVFTALQQARDSVKAAVSIASCASPCRTASRCCAFRHPWHDAARTSRTPKFACRSTSVAAGQEVTRRYLRLCSTADHPESALPMAKYSSSRVLSGFSEPEMDPGLSHGFGRLATQISIVNG